MLRGSSIKPTGAIVSTHSSTFRPLTDNKLTSFKDVAQYPKHCNTMQRALYSRVERIWHARFLGDCTKEAEPLRRVRRRGSNGWRLPRSEK